MRIIGGKHKGKQFHPSKGIKCRPTTGFAKEALFNVLNNRIELEDITVLDLFAGTGNVTYEFISRGAKESICVDSNFHSFKFIKQMSSELDGTIKSVKADVFKFINGKPQKTFDIVFADPPYANEFIREISPHIFKNKWLKEDGILIVEHGDGTNLSDLPNFVECKKYGKVHFSFFEN